MRLHGLILGLAIVTLMSCHNEQKMEQEDVQEQLCGAYGPYEKLSQEELKLFADTYRGEVKLTPLKVAQQVVAGTNYAFLCQDEKGRQYEVVIFQPLPGQGEAEVTSVKRK